MVLPDYSVGTRRATVPARLQGGSFPHLSHLTELCSLRSWLLEAAASLQSWQHSILLLLAVATTFCSQISLCLTPTRNPCDGT